MLSVSRWRPLLLSCCQQKCWTLAGSSQRQTILASLARLDPSPRTTELMSFSSVVTGSRRRVSPAATLRENPGGMLILTSIIGGG
jgi:hypothetical protein